MRKPTGCFKTGCFGCLGVLAVILVIIGVNLLIAWSRMGDIEIQDRELNPSVQLPAESGSPLATGQQPISPEAAGRVMLNLSQGEFHLYPSAPGEGLKVLAHYDDEMYQLDERFETPPDSAWTYTVEFYRTMPWMQALFRQVLGEADDPVVKVYLPREVPIELGLIIQEGGAEADLGGLWLIDAEVLFQKGGFALEVSEPLREPLGRLKIHGSMGGFEAVRLGNASPKEMDVHCRMGGADIDLEGAWRNDCAIDLNVRMGGMSVQAPRDVLVYGVPTIPEPALAPQEEVQKNRLTFRLQQSMGEIDVQQ